MMKELDAAPAIFRPSKYWEILNDKNIAQLRLNGFENFKRTINQNYFNWIPTDAEDNQIRRLTEFFHANPPETPLTVDYRASLDSERGMSDSERKARWDLYANFVGLLWHYTEKTDKHGVLSELSEPEVGNPIRIMAGEKCLSQDLANSVRERNVVMDHAGDGKVVAELGAGYGRLAYVFGATTRCRYLIFDIPPALCVSQWYLGTVFPDRKHMRFRHFERFEDVAQEVEACDFGFFTPNQLPLIPPEYVDAFISISSLQEMQHAQVYNYLDLMARATRGIIYLKQWIEWVNDMDNIVIRKDDYRIRDWGLVLDRTDGVQDKFFERVFTRPRWAEPPTAKGARRRHFLSRLLRDWRSAFRLFLRAGR